MCNVNIIMIKSKALKKHLIKTTQTRKRRGAEVKVVGPLITSSDPKKGWAITIAEKCLGQ